MAPEPPQAVRMSVGMATLPKRPHALYRFFDRSDVLLYVGITVDLPGRMGNHRGEKPWWVAVHHVSVEHFATRREALDAETAAIESEEPLYNVQHNRFATVGAPDFEAMYKELVGWVFGVLGGLEGPDDLDVLAAEHLKAISEDDDPVGLLDHDGNAAAGMISRTSELLMEFHWNALDLVELVPPEKVERIRAEARGRLDRHEAGWYGDARMTASTLVPIADDWASTYLEALPPGEAAEWIAGIKTVLPGSLDAGVQHRAVQYAMAWKHDHATWRGMCSEPGWAGAACPNKAAYKVFFESCPDEADGECAGHLCFCQAHMDEGAASKEWYRVGDGTPVAVARFEPADEMEAPF